MAKEDLGIADRVRGMVPRDNRAAVDVLGRGTDRNLNGGCAGRITEIAEYSSTDFQLLGCLRNFEASIVSQKGNPDTTYIHTETESS